jgi:hypothetical protein
MIATADPVHGTGQRHRVVAIGSGLGGLTATKALKHAQINITDALVFLTRITAQAASHVVNPTPLWLQVIPAAPAVATTVGVLIALSVAVVGELTKRVVAQAHFWWTTRIDNASNAVTTIRVVDANATDANASEVPGGCKQALMGAIADDIISAARDSLCHGHLRRSRPLAKGWS